ncbi:uncharacterized protein LOC129000952 isoform X3 [Macrosteles quadrilineatus]|uniref:uncharacterized protein LOC129000952 isoform X3 n=1 Tax=Macrosteles quadrilineatus TaxID=74068 RepID=UPI0023E30752|nr:uncharacterized protein LOC129000952 isoform X3 [Macrosteles quadrilineatus]
MASVCIGLLLILTLPDGLLSDTCMDVGMKNFITGNLHFQKIVQLPPPKPRPEQELKYVFVLVKHAMAVPEYDKEKTFPGDKNYQKHWVKDSPTTSSGKCRWMNFLKEQFYEDDQVGPKHFTRCSEGLYTLLQGFIKNEDNLSENEEGFEWVMNNPEQIYKLWSMLVFQILQGQKEPEWAKDNWTWIQSCVFENYRKFLTYHPAIPAMLSGRMIQQMEEETSIDRQVLFHVHVTSDIALLNMNWTLPFTTHSHWPDPGDALIYEFYTEDKVEVWSFSGWLRNFDPILSTTREEFFQHYKNRHIYFDEEQWNSLCDYDKENNPTSLPNILLTDPTIKDEKLLLDYRETYGYKEI